MPNISLKHDMMADVFGNVRGQHETESKKIGHPIEFVCISKKRGEFKCYCFKTENEIR